LITHANGLTHSNDWTVRSALVGLLFMFMLIRVFHFNQHGTLEDDVGAACDHDGHGHDHEHKHGPGVVYSWLGLAFGLALHTLIDGVALGAAVKIDEMQSGGAIGFLGIGTFLAVLLHKPLDAMSITTIMHAGQWSDRAIRWINFAFSLMCPLGAALFYFGVSKLGARQEIVVGTALAFAGGVFLCISLADILPEVSFHSHDRLLLTSALLFGVLLAVGIGFIEHPHWHGAEGHDHSQHDHQDEHSH
jgi:zinc and cadmium transporter